MVLCTFNTKQFKYLLIFNTFLYFLLEWVSLFPRFGYVFCTEEIWPHPSLVLSKALHSCKSNVPSSPKSKFICENYFSVSPHAYIRYQIKIYMYSSPPLHYYNTKYSLLSVRLYDWWDKWNGTFVTFHYDPYDSTMIEVP